MRERGFVLIVVAVALVLVASIAMLVTTESAIEAERAGTSVEALEADYVARAGLAHALWQNDELACAGDFNVPTTMLGMHSYSASIAGGGATTSYTLNVDADAWIDSGSVTSNKGGDSGLHIKGDAGDLEQPIYRFDLSPLPAGAQINSAVASFYVSTEHADGPVTVHRITASWNEGGVTWNAIDGRVDDGMLATIPAQPDKDVRVEVSLTAQVQAWVNGQPNNGILLASDVAGVHGQYASREAGPGAQPLLHVVVGTSPASPVAIAATGTLTSGVSRTLGRPVTPAYQETITTILQPDEAAGTDTYIYKWRPTWNYGVNNAVWADYRFADSIATGLLRFDLGSIPRGARVRRATLELYQTNNSLDGGPVGVHRVTAGWDEGAQTQGTGPGANWSLRTTLDPWASPGGDYAQAAVATTEVPADTGPVTWDIAELVDGWVSGRYANAGLALVAEKFGTAAHFASSSDSDPIRRPKLTIEFACECGNACLVPGGAGAVLMLVGNDLLPSAGDLAKQALMESWGYTVDLVGEIASAAALQAAMSTRDVLFVASSVNAVVVGTKLTNLNAPIVSEVGELADEIGFASSASSGTGNDATVVDTNHYITYPFLAGPVEIYAASMAQTALSGAPSPDLTTLATNGSAANLAVLEPGSQLATGGTAPARRAMLPFGPEQTMRWDYVSNAGLLIFNRTLQWGIGVSLPPPVGQAIWLATRDDVSASGAPGLDSWTNGEAIAVADPSLALEPGTTGGTFYPALNFDPFASDGHAEIDAIHYVTSDVTVGGVNSVELFVGDVLISTAANESLTSNNTVVVEGEDVFVFRPLSGDDYATGTFIFLLDGSLIHTESDTVAVSLVEQATTIGDANLARGSFLFATTGDPDVFEFTADDVGLGTTAGSVNLIIEGNDLDFDEAVYGLDLAESEVALGGQTIPSGSLLVTLYNDDTDGVGDNSIAVAGADIFYLSVTTTGSNTAADAIRLFEGLDAGLDTTQEYVHALTLTTPPASSGVIDVPIAAPDDDAEENTTFGIMYLDSGDLELAVDGISTDLVGLRFANVSLPPGATITNAYVQFQVDEVTTGVATLVVRGQDADDAVTFTSSGFDISSRAVTTSSVAWLPPPWPSVGARDAEQRTPDLSAVVQEIVDRPGWASGNALAIIIDGVGKRTAEAYEGGPTGAAVLHVEYSGGGEGSGPTAHWMLDDGTGTTAIDSAGGHHGTLVNGPAWVAGHLGDALQFDGSNDHVDLTSDAELDDIFLGGATVTAWISPTGWGSNGYGRVFDKSTSPSSTGDGWAIRLNTDNHGLNFGQGFTGGRGWWRIPSNSINLGQWQHVAVAYDATSTANDPIIYLDGNPVAVTRVDAPSGDVRSDAAITLHLGSHASSLTTLFEGRIDDARIYDRMLSAAEVADLAAEGSGGGGGGGGDGGGSCDGTFRDEFNARSYSGNDGTLVWSGDWHEVGEGNGPTAGDIGVGNDQSNYQLRTRDNDNGGEGVERDADLSGAATATLSYDYRRQGLDNPNDYTRVGISANGGPWNELARHQGPGSDSDYVSVSHDISAHVSSNTRIRFLTSANMGNNDVVWFDNVEIACSP